jgi:hypothetical protein
VGGDVYDAARMTDGRRLLFVADVVGKTVEAPRSRDSSARSFRVLIADGKPYDTSSMPSPHT